VTCKRILQRIAFPYFEFFGEARWVSLPEESSHTPSRGDAEYSYECKANRMIDNRAFAPTLEHGDRSNDK
jgi:hypothetical protein